MDHIFTLPFATASVHGRTREAGRQERVAGRGRARRVETEWGKESIATFILEMGLELLIPVAGPFAIVSLRL